MEVVTTVEFERYVANACIVRDKFSHELSPSILLIVDKIPEVGLYYNVLPLNLVVNLRVEDNRELCFILKK